MGIAIASFIVTFVALIVSIGFNVVQSKWRKEDREQYARDRKEYARERAEVQAQRERQEAEQRHKDRMPPEFYNFDGTASPLRISGLQMFRNNHDLWGTITVVNPTQGYMKVTPQRLVIEGVDCDVTFEFRLKANDNERQSRISLVSDSKEHYNLHFLFPQNNPPRGKTGDLWLTSSNRGDEPFVISVTFPD